MALLSSVLGFSLFGLAARFGQLGIQKRPLFQNLQGHAITVGAFAFIGYWAHQWDERAKELIAEKRAEITARRQRQLQAAEDKAVAALEG